jgi:hypothetical protein
MIFSDDPARDFLQQDMEKERRLARLPICEEKKCGKRIDDEHYYEIDNEILCEECMINRYRKWTEDFIL